MQYHIDTIPVWDALREHDGCPMCALRARLENDAVDYFLGGSVMEPDIRIRVNQKGFCTRHQFLLNSQKNKLGHALMLLSHTDEILAALNGLSGRNASPAKTKKLFRSARSSDPDVRSECRIADLLEQLSASCVICDRIQENMDRYVYTFLHLYKNDPAFRKEYTGSKGVCLKDASVLIKAAQQQYQAELYETFSALLLRQLKESLSEDRADLEWFTQKFDYRNADKPWGNSKDAVERTANCLQGYCIGKNPDSRSRK